MTHTGPAQATRRPAAPQGSERQLRDLLGVAGVGVWILDADGRTTFANKALANMLGTNREAMLLLRASELLGGEAAEAAMLLGRPGDEPAEQSELQLPGARGEGIWVLVSVTPLSELDGSSGGLLAIMTDITSRKHAELEVRRRAALVDLSPDAILSKDRDGNVTDWNREAERRYGYSAAEIIGRPVSVLVPEQRRGEEKTILDRILSGEEIDHYETQRQAKDGSLVEVSIHAAAVRDSSGEIIGAMSIAREIGEEIRTREALRNSEELLRGGFEHSPIGMSLTNPDGRLRRVNAAFARMLGYDDPQQLVGIAFASITHPDDVAGDRQGIRMMLAEGRPYTAEKRYLRRDGEVVNVILGSTVVRAADGHPVAFFTQLEDITDRKRAERELADMRGLLERTQEISRTGGWEYEVATSRLTWTDEVYRIYGSEPTSDPADVTSAIAAFHDKTVLDAAFERLVTAGEPYDLELQLNRIDGQRIWVRTSGRPVIEDGRVIRVGGNIVDVTDRRQAQEEIRTLNAELEQRVAARTSELHAANHELEAFAYSLAHDLRAPLRAVEGFGAALARHCAKALGDQGEELLGRMRAASVRMGELIDAMLLLSELTRCELAPARVDLSAMAGEISDELRARDPARAVEFVIEGGLETVGDPQLVRVLMVNLLENAWKFTSRSETPRIEVARAGPGVFAVRDNGAGFDTAFAGLLFKPFARLHREDEFPGTGIGLTTVQRIVSRHGGAVWGQGRPDDGAAFYFTFEPHEENGS